MTPAQKMGLKVGDKVVLIDDSYTKDYEQSILKGDILTLTEDDGTNCPKFRKGDIEYYEYLYRVKIIADKHTTVTGPATITVADGETITFEGNATVKQDWVPKFGDRVTFIDPPSDMVGEFGVVIENDNSSLPYCVTYNDGDGSDIKWVRPDKIKPYEAE